MRNKWIYTVFVLALCLFASCNNEADDASKQKTRTVVFRLAVDDAVGSRSGTTWGGNTSLHQGEGIENRIKLEGLGIAIYSITNGKADQRLGIAENLTYWTINESESTADQDPIEYQLVGDISHLNLETNKEYRFVVWANFPNSTNTTFALEDIDVKKGYIPMWGATTYRMTGGNLEQLGTINLLRAVAKVEVSFDTDVTNHYEISSLAVKNYNSTGDALPTGWKDCRETKDLDMETCINATASNQKASLPFLENKDSDGKYYIYVPEYNNAWHDSMGQSVVVVTLADKTGARAGKTYEIPFCQYSGGAPVANTVHSIVRNHIYRFNVAGVAVGSLLLNFKVADWDEASSIELCSLAYPTYLNPVLPSRDHGYPSTSIEESPTMKYVPNGTSESFEMYFHFISANDVTGSSDYVWKPTIVNMESTAYSIAVYKEVSSDFTELVYKKESTQQTASTDKLKVEVNSSTEKSYEGWFKIVVTPANPVEENTKFIFGIACGVHPSGFLGDDFFLFINGENDQIAWPDSGNDRKFIEITQTVD